MRVLNREKQLTVLGLLLEGNSRSSIHRITGVHRDSIASLINRFGQACKRFHDREIRDLNMKHVQVDELETFVRKKKEKVTGQEPDAGTIGQTWVTIALDEASRLIAAYRVGGRKRRDMEAFMSDLAARFTFPKPAESDGCRYRISIRVSTDGLKAYRKAIPFAFGPYAMHGVIRKKIRINGVQIVDKTRRATTSLVERNNLNLRTFMEPLTRKTCAFAKKLESLKAALAIHVAFHNYCWVHRGQPRTPAQRAGLASRRLSLAELYDEVKKCAPELVR